jgi:PAS domain S-box-containing protein
MSENKLRILLVDDDQVDRLAFLRHVERQALPYECKTAGSVAEARAIPRSEKFDVIILDHNLTDGTGFDLLPDFTETPVIFLTGSESPEIAVRAMKAGAADYLLKDHDRNYLKLTPLAVERALRQQRDRDQLLESQELFRHSFSEAPIGKAFVASDGRFLRVNRALCDMFGYTEAEFLAGGFHMISQTPDTPGGMEQLFQKLSGTVRTRRAEMPARHKEGQELWIQLDIAQVPGSRGQALTYVLQVQNITAQRQAEEVRTRLETRLYQSQKMEALGSLAGGVAHEFNNMLGSIMGYTELSKMELGDQHPTSAKLEQVLKASQRAKEVIQQILTFSRRQELKRELLNLTRVVQDAMKAIRLTIPHSVDLLVEIGPDCPPVYGNSTQIHQALTNLCTNAWHAMEPTGGRIILTQKTIMLNRDVMGSRLALPEGRYSVLSINDNGQGMDAATMERVFEPFFTTKGPGKGSGLGMAVVHGIMKSHDGAVSIQSQQGSGTTVYLYFPVPSAELAEKPPLDQPPAPHGHGERVLLVDDEPTLVMISTKILQHLGYKVTGFTSAKEALAAFTRQPEAFDLVITDLTMPGMTGIALADALLEVRRDTPILLATGYIEDSIREQASLLGFREIIVKPLATQSLAEAVQRVLAKKT